MIKIVGKSTRVVELPEFYIDELAGNVASKEDTLSVARVVVTQPTSEPWLTLHYDEWICVLKGKVEMHFHEDNDTSKEVTILTVLAGETCFVGKGQRFRPIFPVGDTEYIPVCIPAFKPERCIREEDGEVSDVSKKLQSLHAAPNGSENSCTTQPPSPPLPAAAVEVKVEKLYHMCQKQAWEEALSKKTAYFPPTFVHDEYYTHATAVAARLIETANHFYTASEGDWICVEIDFAALTALGISVRFEAAMPVGDQNVSDDWNKWICPHIYGGIPGQVEGVVNTTYPMIRDDKGNFLRIEGVWTIDSNYIYII